MDRGGASHADHHRVQHLPVFIDLLKDLEEWGPVLCAFHDQGQFRGRHADYHQDPDQVLPRAPYVHIGSCSGNRIRGRGRRGHGLIY